MEAVIPFNFVTLTLLTKIASLLTISFVEQLPSGISRRNSDDCTSVCTVIVVVGFKSKPENGTMYFNQLHKKLFYRF